MTFVASWWCWSGEEVGRGDAVAVSYGGTTELVARIIDGTRHEVTCEVIRDSGMPPGHRLILSPNQLLLKVVE